MTEYITGALFKAMILNGAAALENHKSEINDLNVFPVPDGDTGTNMSLTMNRGVRDLNDAGELATVGEAAAVAAKALFRGSRGNSGVILSALFRGMSEQLQGLKKADAAAFSAALSKGVEVAYKNVIKPTEGTLLTVSRFAAHAAGERAEQTRDIEDVLEAALESGRIALANTVNQNPVLKKAGVIDSGGKGYIYILDGMLRALRGEVITVTSVSEAPRETADFKDFESGDIKFAYCTEFIILRENNRNPDSLKAFLEKIGDSLVVAADEEAVKVHVHTNQPGNVISEALKYGSLSSVKIDNMREQHSERLFAESEKSAAAPAVPVKKYGMAVVCVGAGIESVFRDLGADQIITGGQTMNPSTDDILSKIEATPSEIVFVFPNNKNITMAAQQCIPLSTKKVVVIPTRSAPQGVSAMLEFDENLDEAALEQAMMSAMKKVRTILVTHAARDSVFDEHEIKEGQYLTLLDDTLLAYSEDFSHCAAAIAETVVSCAPEFITVFTGEEASGEETKLLLENFNDSCPDTEVVVINGGQPLYRYIISAE